MSDWKNNRPPDWANGWDKEREEDGMASKYEIFEAGADAMLEILKKQGSYLNGDTVIPAQGKFPEIHCPGGMIGWIVFIEGSK